METKPTQTDAVDAYMKELLHPLKDVMASLRAIIMSTDKEIGEEVKWNAPTFFYAGPMKPSDPKAYKRYLIVTNLHREKSVMLVLPSGARVDDGSGLLTGTYADGRRLLEFSSIEDVEANKPALQKVIRDWLNTLDKN